MNGINGHHAALTTTIKIIFLDSDPLSFLSDARIRPITTSISAWATSLLAAGHIIYVPEVIDYELRRELLRAGKGESIKELDAQKSRFVYAPLTTAAMLLAADLWQNITL